MRGRHCRLHLIAVLALIAGLANAGPPPNEVTVVGTIKVAKGEVNVERGGEIMPATVGMAVLASDRIATGADGSVGITFEDNSLLSLGPESRLAIDQFRFDRTTHDGRFETTLSRGKLAVVSGKIAKRDLEGMKVRTPNSLLGVRGTEFVVEAGE